MTGEASVIAARLAAASEVFPMVRPDAFAARVDVTAEGDVLHVTVSERGGEIREYRARLALVGNTAPAADPSSGHG